MTPSAILEVTELSRRAETLSRGSATERRQAEVLIQRISTIKQTGISSDEARGKYATALADNLATPRPVTETPEYERRFIRYLYGRHETQERELRDLLAGQQTISWTQGPAGGYTIPIDYEKKVFEAMANFDPMLNSDVCDFTMEPSVALQPKVISGYDLTTFTAAQVGESGTQLGQNVPTVSGRVLRANITYRASLVASFEAEQDIPDWLSKASRAFGIAFARGAGKDAVTGNGTTQPQGIYTAAPASGVTLGSGAYGQAVGKITQEELNAIYFSIDRVHRAAPKAGWLMTDATYQKLRRAVDNQGRPLLDISEDEEELLGKPIYVSPALSNLSGSPLQYDALIFGDLDHFKVRVNRPTIQRVLSSPAADILKGEALYVARLRMDSALFDPSGGVKPPIVSAVVHS